MALKMRCHHQSTSQTMSGQLLPVLTWQLVPSRSHTCYPHLQRWDQFIIPNQKHSKTSHLNANHVKKNTDHETTKTTTTTTTTIMKQHYSTAYIEISIKQQRMLQACTNLSLTSQTEAVTICNDHCPRPHLG